MRNSSARRLLRWGLVINLLGLWGCSMNPRPLPPGGVVERGSVYPRAVKLYSGVMSYENSKSLLLVIPNRLLFEARAARFTKQAPSLLSKLVTKLRARSSAAVISITSYPAPKESEKLAPILAHLRAQLVMDYLWQLPAQVPLIYEALDCTQVARDFGMMVVDGVTLQVNKVPL